MTYETIVQLSQIGGLLFFVALFVVVVVYAMRPRNKSKFERAARIPLDGGDRPAEPPERPGERNG
jgi:cytochrome c oxidase cbb3-type subunit IV